MSERWLPVSGYEGFYEVSDQGRVKSVKRIVRSRHNWHAGNRTVNERILKELDRPSGRLIYKSVNLSKEGVRNKQPVHRLVLEAFVGACPDGMETLHRNGDPADNRLENLHWGTPAENNLDILRHHGWRGRPPGGDTCRNGHVYADVGVKMHRGQRRCLACAANSMRNFRERRRSEAL